MDSILVTTTTTMRITFVNLLAILLALVVGAVALPNDDNLPNIVDRDNYDPNSNNGGGPSHFSFSFSLRLPFFCSTRR
jgi:hypothetical protein